MSIMIIDSNNICHIVGNAIPELSVDDSLTHIIYGFLSSIFSLHKYHVPDYLVFCWDSKKSFRKIAYPEYKANRREDLDEQGLKDLMNMFRQFSEIRLDVLPALGFSNIFMRSGFEGDDLIARIVEKYPKEFFCIVSTDKDLYQLLTKNIVILNPITKKKMTRTKFINEYGINPEQWAEAKSMAGDGGDNITGIEKVGEKTAIKFINGELPEHHKTYERITSEEGQRIKKRNLPLIKLPFESKFEIKINLVEQQQLLRNDFKKVFNHYEFDSFLKPANFDQWVQCFNLK